MSFCLKDLEKEELQHIPVRGDRPLLLGPQYDHRMPGCSRNCNCCSTKLYQTLQNNNDLVKLKCFDTVSLMHIIVVNALYCCDTIGSYSFYSYSFIMNSTLKVPDAYTLTSVSSFAV